MSDESVNFSLHNSLQQRIQFPSSDDSHSTIQSHKLIKYFSYLTHPLLWCSELLWSLHCLIISTLCTHEHTLHHHQCSLKYFVKCKCRQVYSVKLTKRYSPGSMCCISSSNCKFWIVKPSSTTAIRSEMNNKSHSTITISQYLSSLHETSETKTLMIENIYFLTIILVVVVVTIRKHWFEDGWQ